MHVHTHICIYVYVDIHMSYTAFVSGKTRDRARTFAGAIICVYNTNNSMENSLPVLSLALVPTFLTVARIGPQIMTW